ncbi:hypothetical protein EJ06DRAFT_479741 [Trichodelitschia bisporula]|uniref:Alpha/beta hydrolase fold-3 domain-containing protein n=1 Tax=Trichodelitschia bisporula TaxID=703511 RepID=A0A6G1HRT9_9PEZI|nr:hypothetical protein EJ06DRAFT_479741 [Trichodelitschia bisporula]
MRSLLADRKRALTASQSGSESTFTTRDTTAPARDGYHIPLRIYAPATPPAGGAPLIVFYHGGGFCLGGLESEELNCRLFASEVGAVVVNVDYRLAPEHPFPAAVNDAWDALKWAAANAASLGTDPSKGFIVGGTSAGGNLAAVTTHLARDEKLIPPVTGFALLIPVLGPPGQEGIAPRYADEIKSYEQNADAPILGIKAVRMFTAAYAPPPTDPLFNVLADPLDTSGLPPLFIQVCGQDPLRDEALVYERVVREEAGGKTRLRVYPGVPHSFWSFAPDWEKSRGFVRDTVEGVKWLLGRGE